MSREDTEVASFRLPRELLERIRAWADEQTPATTYQSAVRHLLERAMSKLERERK